MGEIRSVRRAFEVIDVLWELNGCTSSTVATRLDIPTSTAHDYLQTLESVGYVVNEGGVYRLGFDFLSMGGRLQYRSKLFHVANPVIQSLAEETGEMANVSLEEGGRWVVLYNESGDRALNLGVFPGLKTPLHTHAAGKVILANLPRNRRDSILEDGLEQVTDETITDPDKLRSEFSAIRERGHAFDMDEQIKGMGEIAAPLLDDTGVLGAVAVVCPSGRLADETYRDELTRKIKEATDSISINYQYS